MTDIERSIELRERPSGEEWRMTSRQPYTAAAHWNWFRACEPVRARIDELAEASRRPRRNGLAWCAVDATTPRSEIGSYKRYVDALARIVLSHSVRACDCL
jgi:hypothetical protein